MSRSSSRSQETTSSAIEVVESIAERARRPQERPQLNHASAPPLRSDVGREAQRAAAHAFMGTRRPDTERMQGVKKGVLRLANLFTQEQVVFNDAVVRSLTTADEELMALRARSAAIEVAVEELRRRLEATLTAVDRMATMERRIDALEREVRSPGRRSKSGGEVVPPA